MLRGKTFFIQVLARHVLALFITGFAVEAHSQDSMDSLLQDVMQASAARASEFEEREAAFVEERDLQAEKLANVREQLNSARETKVQLEQLYEQQGSELSEATEQLEQESAEVGELFGSLRQAAADYQSLAQNSLVVAQLGASENLIESLTAASEQPTMQQMQAFWQVLFQHMVASGNVTEFQAPVLDGNGEIVDKRVVRVGEHAIVAEEGFLQYDAELDQLITLPRQPEARHVSSAERILNAEQGPVPFSIDPTRGQLLSMLIQRPSLGERVQQGGFVGYVIIFVGIVGLLLALERGVVLQRINARVNRQMKALSQATSDNPLGRILLAYEKDKHRELDVFETRMDEAVLKETPRLHARVPLIKLMAAIAPLLGLLGTVVGMIQTFQDITLFGTGDPKLMADGISQALVTTALGLTVAVPLILLHSVVANKGRKLTEVLEEQTAGLIAERASVSELKAAA